MNSSVKSGAKEMREEELPNGEAFLGGSVEDVDGTEDVGDVEASVTSETGSGPATGLTDTSASSGALGGHRDTANTTEDTTGASEAAGLDLYIRRIGRYGGGRLLTRREELKLAHRVRAGDKRARGELVERNLRLVVSIAKKYQGRGLALEDLIQEGNQGLVVAADKFDPGAGVKFASYATYWVRQAVGRALQNKARMIRIPVHAEIKLGQLEKARQGLRARLGREPEPSEIAGELGVGLAEVEKLSGIIRDTQRLEAPTSAAGSSGSTSDDGPQRTYQNVARDDAQFADFDGVDATLSGGLPEQLVRTLLSELDDRERLVLERRYGLPEGESHATAKAGEPTTPPEPEPLKLRQVADELGTSKERVRQIHKLALQTLRKRLREDYAGLHTLASIGGLEGLEGPQGVEGVGDSGAGKVPRSRRAA